jgi:hypothetical protein
MMVADDDATARLIIVDYMQRQTAIPMRPV